MKEKEKEKEEFTFCPVKGKKGFLGNNDNCDVYFTEYPEFFNSSHIAETGNNLETTDSSELERGSATDISWGDGENDPLIDKGSFVIERFSTEKLHNFEQKAIREIYRLIPLLKTVKSGEEITKEQETLILEKAEALLERFISRAKDGEAPIQKNINPLNHASTIIFAVLKSNNNMPEISGEKISKMVEAVPNMVFRQYIKDYKDLAQKIDFNFSKERLGKSRDIITLYFFEILMDADINFFDLISRLGIIDKSKLVSRFRKVIACKSEQLNQKEEQLLRQLTEREIETLQYMANNYPDKFINYFSNLVEIIKCLIISNRSHKIIRANFSLSHFIRFLWSEEYNLFLTERGLFEVISRIFNFLKDTKYSDLFPDRFRSGVGKSKHEHERVIGSRIKLFIMKYIYGGIYFDERDGIAKCPECLRKGFVVNTSFPRIKSREFHHEGIKLMGYTAEKLHALFTNHRGNPYFLQYLIKKMEDENIILLCGSHHRKHQCDYLVLFKKLISWENISREFPQDIFELPAEIIHILVIICIENFHLTKIKNQAQKEEIRQELIYRLKERYIIDHIYGGVCIVCGEFNTREHLYAFEFNHLYELRKLSPEESKRFKSIKKRHRQILERFSCSEAIREFQDQVGGFICRNCHAVIHEDMTIANKIYDDQDVLRSVYEDNRDSISRYKENLISDIDLGEDPLKSGVMKLRAFADYLFRFFKIMEEKGVITSGDLARDKKCDRRTVSKFFRGRENDLEKYGTIKFGDNRNQTRFYMNDECKKIVRLLKYFKQYYQNLY